MVPHVIVSEKCLSLEVDELKPGEDFRDRLFIIDKNSFKPFSDSGVQVTAKQNKAVDR